MTTRNKTIRERVVDLFIVLVGGGDASGATSAGRGINALSDEEQDGPLTQQEYNNKQSQKPGK